MHLVGARGFGPCFLAHALDRRFIEPAEIGRCFGVEPSPRHHGLRAALLERRVVEIGIGPGVEHFQGERRRHGTPAYVFSVYIGVRDAHHLLLIRQRSSFQNGRFGDAPEGGCSVMLR